MKVNKGGKERKVKTGRVREDGKERTGNRGLENEERKGIERE